MKLAASTTGRVQVVARQPTVVCPAKVVLPITSSRASVRCRYRNDTAPEGKAYPADQAAQVLATLSTDAAWTSMDEPQQLLVAAGPKPIDKYLLLRELRATEPLMYHKFMVHHSHEVLPFIYTPTVGQACSDYHVLGIRTRGLYLTLEDKGNILNKLKAWPQKDIKVIVVTDGERILGLGDLGANGMGISEGKIELYTAAAGVDPNTCLPVCLDVGTNNVALRDHPAYRGMRRPRPADAEYDAFVDEFMQALKAWQPNLLLQFEDFGNHNAFRLLERYQPTHCCFNDDIQGTASITLAAVLAALRVKQEKLSQQRILFLGAGEAAAGIATLIAECINLREGVEYKEALKRCYLIDSKGLVCKSRTDLQHHKVPFAHDVPAAASLLDAVKTLRPTAIIGVSAQPAAFTKEIVELMAEINERPIIFPLSNPTKLAECTFQQAFEWTKGQVLFASGSPFDDITDSDGVVHHPPQANNAYIFPGVGYAAILTKAKTIPNVCFLIAAEKLAGMAYSEELARGSLFPPFNEIRDISASIMADVMTYLVDNGYGTVPAGWDRAEATSAGKANWRRKARRAQWCPLEALGLPTPPTNSSRL